MSGETVKEKDIIFHFAGTTNNYHIDVSLNEGATYFYAVTAVDNSGRVL